MFPQYPPYPSGGSGSSGVGGYATPVRQQVIENSHLQQPSSYKTPPNISYQQTQTVSCFCLSRLAEIASYLQKQQIRIINAKEKEGKFTVNRY